MTDKSAGERKLIAMQDILDKWEEVQIKAEDGDFEAVHSIEDQLKDLVLAAVRDGDLTGASARMACKLALQSNERMVGQRYCA